MRLGERIHLLWGDLGKLTLAVGVAGSLCVWGSATGQARTVINGPVMVAGEAEAPGTPGAPAPGNPDSPVAVNLETDSDVDNLLVRAGEYVRDGKYREASLVLQHVMEKSANVMTSQDGQVFIPARQAAESIILSMGAEGLAIYRLVVDGPARAMLPDEDAWLKEASLREVVRRYGASTIGPEAAYRLGCLLLDRQDYRGARQVFRWLLDLLAQPGMAPIVAGGNERDIFGNSGGSGNSGGGASGGSGGVDQREVLVRLALASTRAGDRQTAQSSLLQWRRLSRGDNSLVRMIESSLDASGATVAAAGSSDWLMNWGNARRDGIMSAPLTDQVGNSSLSLLWINPHERKNRLHPQMEAQLRRFTSQHKPQTRSQLISRWQQNRWTPAAQILYQGDRVLVKTDDILYCYHLDSGQLLWRSEPKMPTMAPDIQIYFEGGFNSVALTSNQPSTPQERACFQDRLSTSAAVIQGVVYSIEGESGSSMPGVRFRASNNGRNVPLGARHSLAAYDLNTGKLRWRSGSDLLAEDENTAIHFRSTPLAYADHLLAVVEVGKSLHLAIIQPTDGSIIRKVFLCSEIPDGDNEISPLAMAMDGSDLYISTGRGLVLALDGTDGSMRWATRYPRLERDTRTDPRMRFRQVGNRGGGLWSWGKTWNEDALMLAGDSLLLTPSDASQWFVLDRRTGRRILSLDRSEANYCLGLADETLFVAGPATLQGYDVPSGKLRWRASVENVTGRGALTTDRIYLPLHDRIAVFDSASGKRVDEIGVTGNFEAPLGNLYATGRHLLVAGLDQVYALTNLRLHLAELDKRIAAGDGFSRLTRARLNQDAGQIDQALSDLRMLLSAQKVDEGLQQTARQMLLELVLSRAAVDSQQAGVWLDEAASVARSASDRARVSLRRAQWLAGRGAILQAAEQYALVIRDGSDTLVARDQAGWEIQASHWAAIELDRLASKPDESLHTWLQKRGQEAISKQPSDSSAESWLKIARMVPRSPAAFDALQSAVKTYRDQGQPESAELLLKQLAQADHRPQAAAGLTALARFYEQMGWRDSAAATWRRLLERDEHEWVEWEGKTQQAGVLARRQLQAMEPSVSPDSSNAPASDQPDYQLLIHDKNAKASLVLSWGDDQASEFTRDHLLFLSGLQGQLICRSLASGRTIWTISSLRAGGENPPHAGPASVLWPTRLSPDGQLPRTGHLGFLANDEQIQAFSLINGRQLWSASVGRVVDVQQYQRLGLLQPFAYSFESFAPVAADRDQLAMVRRNGTTDQDELAVLDATTGSLLWKRSPNRMTLEVVAIVGDYVAALYNVGDVCELYQRDTGTLAYRLTLADRIPNSPIILLPQGVLVQEAQGLTMRAWTTGKAIWATTSRGTHYRLVKVGDDALGVLSYPSQQLSIVQIGNGKLVDQYSLSGLDVQAMVATPDGQQIIVTGHKPPNRLALTTLDLSTGQVSLPLDMGVQLGQIQNDQTLTAAWVPTLQSVTTQGQLSSAPTNLWQVGLIRRSDGQSLGNLKLPLPANAQWLAGMVRHPLILGRAMVFMAQDGLFVYVNRAGTNKMPTRAGSPPAHDPSVSTQP